MDQVGCSSHKVCGWLLVDFANACRQQGHPPDAFDKLWEEMYTNGNTFPSQFLCFLVVSLLLHT